MKITHIITGLDVGGAEIALKNIVEHSEKNNIFQNKVISLTRIGVVGKKLQAEGVEVDALNLRTVWDVLPVIYKLTKLIKKQNPDIVQTWMYHADLFGGIAAKIAGVKKIFWGIRCTDVLAGKGVARSTYYIMRLCSLLSNVIPSKIICVAESALKTHQNFGYSKDKMQVIHNGCNGDIYNVAPATGFELRKQLNIPDGSMVIGSVGRFNEYKDHNNFIKAAFILGSRNDKIIFLMIGKNINSDNKLLMEWINATGFSERFILLGERNDGDKILNAMDIFCLHSRSEAFPNVVVEAMCAGLPCVVTDVGDSVDMVGKFGVVVPAEDAEALAGGLARTIDVINTLSPSERLSLQHQYRNHILENYSIDNAVLQYKSCYEDTGKSKKQLDVLHIITGLDVGGAELSLKNFIEYSENEGVFHNKVISLTDVGVVGEKLRAIGIEVIPLNIKRTFDIPRGILKLTRFIKKQNPDIIQTWMYHADLLGGIASRLAGKCNIFWSIHCSNIFDSEGTSRSTYFVMKICSLLSSVIPKKIICVAQSSQATHLEFNYVENKMRVIPNGCNLDAYNIDLDVKAEMREKLAIPKDAIVIGSVGRFNECKDHYSFIMAAKKLLDSNENLLFLLIGRDVDYENRQLIQWIDNSGLRSNFMLLGERSAINLYFSVMDIFCLHSKSEALPNVIIEAMGTGIPCVVTDVGDCARMVGKNGVTVPPENPELLADGLQKIINLTAQERFEIGKKSRKYALENYSLKIVVNEYNNLYRANL